MFEVLMVVCAFALQECKSITALNMFETRAECQAAGPSVYSSFLRSGTWPPGNVVEIVVFGCGRGFLGVEAGEDESDTAPILRPKSPRDRPEKPFKPSYPQDT